MANPTANQGGLVAEGHVSRIHLQADDLAVVFELVARVPNRCQVEALVDRVGVEVGPPRPGLGKHRHERPHHDPQDVLALIRPVTIRVRDRTIPETCLHLPGGKDKTRNSQCVAVSSGF